jgi:Ca-activated chloride channel homolog
MRAMQQSKFEQRAIRPRVRRPSRSRAGAILPLVAILIPTLIILIGFSVNIAYMELARTELRLTCDSAVKAALVNYGATQSQSKAISFAQGVATRNTVGGQTLAIPSGSFVFGNSVKQSSGAYQFKAGATPINSVQITGTASVQVPFAAMISSGDFMCTQMSYATRISHDIVLVLDRSASMAFDLSGNEFVYPPDRTLYSPLQSYFTPPSTTASRWAALTSAVNSFVSVLQARNLDVRVALVTYADNFSLGNYSATQASLDVPLTSSYALVPTAMNVWGTTPLLGDTDISAGLALAQGELTGSLARTTADRTIILLTDGVATTGDTNIAALTSSYRTGSAIVTHVITFGGEAATGSIQSMMMAAAANGNGMFFNAATSSQLQTAFQTIADSLPAVLVK